MTRALSWNRLAAAAALSPAAVLALPGGPAPATEHKLVEQCTTTALTPEEIEGGATSEVTCAWVEPGEPVAGRSADILLAVHYDSHGGYGPSLSVYGPSCSGGVSFGSSDPWNNRISSTVHRSCGGIKHYTGANYTGTTQDSVGPWGWTTEMNGTLDNNVSSLAYTN